MKLARKLKRRIKKMKSLNFPEQTYTVKDNKYVYDKSEDSIVGQLELLWSAIHTAPVELNKKEHKVNKRLKTKLREITRYKDEDKDARITRPGPQVLILEEDELDLLKKLLESGKFTSLASDDLDTLWEIIDEAKDYKLPKPELVQDASPNPS